MDHKNSGKFFFSIICDYVCFKTIQIIAEKLKQNRETFDRCNSQWNPKKIFFFLSRKKSNLKVTLASHPSWRNFKLPIFMISRRCCYIIFSSRKTCSTAHTLIPQILYNFSYVKYNVKYKLRRVNKILCEEEKCILWKIAETSYHKKTRSYIIVITKKKQNLVYNIMSSAT